MSAPEEVIRTAARLIADLSPAPKCIMAHHFVPHGQVYRQWNTRGELLWWANRTEIEELPRHAARSDGWAIAPNAIDTAMLASVPVILVNS